MKNKEIKEVNLVCNSGLDSEKKNFFNKNINEKNEDIFTKSIVLIIFSKLFN